MTRRLRWPIALAVAFGLAATIWAIGAVGLGELLAAVDRLGIGGFAALCGYTIATYAVLGAAWFAACPGIGAARLPLFGWARAVREASSDLLPFSQIGGLVVGTRTLLAHGLSAPRIYAATIVDLTTEMAGQFVLTLYGLWALAALLIHGGASIGPAAWVGAGICVIVLAAFVALQRPMLSLAARIGARTMPDAKLPFASVRAELDRLYAERWPVVLSFLANVVAWLMTGLLAWMALEVMGSRVTLGRAVALESLILAVRSAAFMIPGGLGVQEAAYLLLAHAFGIDPQAAIALSLVKRARDVAIGLPTLLIWQATEWRAGMRAAA